VSGIADPTIRCAVTIWERVIKLLPQLRCCFT